MKALFIGNSYTSHNDMPAVLARVAKENGKDLTTDFVVKGGRFLAANRNPEDAETQKILELIGQNEYDVCFLQEQSVRPVTDPDLFFDSVDWTCRMVKDACKRIVLYETWGRCEGSANLAELNMSSEEMYLALSKSYHSVADRLGLEYSPVGSVFLYLYRHNPSIELYRLDCSHPSYVGSCIAVLCHYRVIFGEFPEKTDCLYLSDRVLSAIREAMEASFSL